MELILCTINNSTLEYWGQCNTVIRYTYVLSEVSRKGLMLHISNKVILHKRLLRIGVKSVNIHLDVKLLKCL